MTRRPKTQRVPRTRAGGEWTEAAFWSFLRSNLRLASIKWPPISQAKKRYRRPTQSGDKRRKWDYQCQGCLHWFKGSEVEVEHIEPCGTLKCWEDLEGFARRLFVEPDGLTVLCEKCHSERTQKARTE